MWKIIKIGILFFIPVILLSEELPKNFIKYKENYYNYIEKYWKDILIKELIAAQIEQESGWKINAELKTDREYGFGLSQITIAYKKDGSERFNNFLEAKKKYRELKDWEWEDKFSPEKHIIFVILEDFHLYKKLENKSGDELSKFSFMLSAYNGGLLNLLKEIELCSEDSSCKKEYWFCNVEQKNARSKIVYGGYKKSFFQINREYPKKIIFKRLKKYVENRGK